MSKKINKKFLKLYVELDSHCCDRLGVKAGGVTEYINRLESAKFAPKRDETLDSLNKYRNVRNILANDPKAMKKSKILTKQDLKWIKKFNKTLKKKKDSISSYLKKARKFARNRKLKRVCIVLALAGAAAAAYFITQG
jgi:mRNA-degrading endonuclease RelE of RelBE toxin-antitoxin system